MLAHGCVLTAATISPAEMFRFVLFVCNYPGGPHVAEATWPWTFLYLLEFSRSLLALSQSYRWCMQEVSVWLVLHH